MSSAEQGLGGQTVAPAFRPDVGSMGLAALTR